jgi:hypothetical protein
VEFPLPGATGIGIATASAACRSVGIQIALAPG